MVARGVIWLVGMMGAGKSAVGAVLAARLGLPLVDTDEVIVREAGCSIPEIFERAGEPEFRRMEREAVERAGAGGGVVALGGGAIAQPEVARLVAGSGGSVVYLRARPETLLERVGEDEERPLLRGLAPQERLARLRALLEDRRAAYESAGIAVDTDGRSPEAIAQEIAQALEEAP